MRYEFLGNLTTIGNASTLRCFIRRIQCGFMDRNPLAASGMQVSAKSRPGVPLGASLRLLHLGGTPKSTSAVLGVVVSLEEDARLPTFLPWPVSGAGPFPSLEKPGGILVVKLEANEIATLDVVSIPEFRPAFS
ncbi:hypothetical protein COLO4_37509 [Corchorus olitorius]|uniref:Uncharacterized protein n=1 Tax=Corchorus olitorius TaxID=93759 RepID=A0A1R3G156_9ROSI|nr:hypothetical protein COLO4_37509 [Corchorus olitorius]